MDEDAQLLMTAALKHVALDDSFSATEIGARVGLNKFRAQAAARTLSNDGVLVLGFDGAAEFSDDFRKSKTKAPPKPTRKRSPR